jgi:hypothetical protein
MSRHLERLLEIDSLIRNNTRSTNKNIAEALEVSERTVRSDLAFLRDRLNAPLEFSRSKGHHYTDAEWRLPSISLSQGELFALTLGARMLQASPKKTGFVDAFGKPRTLVKEVQLYLDNSQVQKIFKKIGEIAQLNEYLDLPNTWISGDKFWELVYMNVIDTADNLDCELEDEPDRRSLLLAVKAATLPPSRKKQLVKKGLAIFPTEDRSELKELEEAENRPRYIIHSSDYKTTYSQAIAYFNDKEPKRILWVVNTVDRCRQIANDLEELLNSDRYS